MKSIISVFFGLSFFVISNVSVFGQVKDSSFVMKKILSKSSLSGQWFLAYDYSNYNNLNIFALKRGYFTVKTTINKDFSLRYTQDITLDKEGSDAGNIETRMKYLYLKIKADRIKFLKNSYFEVGLAHRPWIDFEQKLNCYRVADKMFLEKYSAINSTDFGIAYFGLLGGKVSEKYQKEVSRIMPGKYGSFAVGVFNGGGYHAIERNNNKTVEARLSLRLLPNIMPGFQLSYSGAYGKANVDSNFDSEFSLNVFLLSSQSKYHSLIAQYYFGKGDFKGEYIDKYGNSYKNNGYSFFGEFKIPKTNFALFGRYDNFISHQTEKLILKNVIGGLSYRFLNNKLLFDVNSDIFESEIISVYEIALEIVF